MIQPHGWPYVELGNFGSESCAEKKIELLSEKEYREYYPPVPASDFAGNRAIIGQHGWPLFHQRLKDYLSEHAKPGDIICHPFGRAHQELVSLYPQCHHWETGIGYSDAPFGAWRTFETHGWRQWHWGKWEYDPALANDKGQNRIYSWVTANSFDLSDWPYYDSANNEDYILYMGRIDECKGMVTISEIIRENSKQAAQGSTKLLRWIFAGQGNFEQALMRHVLRDPAPDPAFLDLEYRGVVNGRDRAALAGRARCVIAPTNFIEPFNGSHIECALAGTPAVSSGFGAFCETIEQGVTGYRCQTLGDYLAAIEATKTLDRSEICRRARSKYSLETIGKQYNATLHQISELSTVGWYSTKSWSIPSLTK